MKTTNKKEVENGEATEALPKNAYSISIALEVK
jgi:hypothetical protein